MGTGESYKEEVRIKKQKLEIRAGLSRCSSRLG